MHIHRHGRTTLPIVMLLTAELAVLASRAHAQDPFAENVRTTPWLSPEDERKSFRLPEGFEVQLVASEPEIQKPLNMAFDARGRLWVTDTREYPYPVKPPAKGRDTIKVLDDFGEDGRARRVSVFAGGLNIPIGLYPYRSGVIAFSIPDISFYEDTDGDGKADRIERLYGPMGWERDTHGLNNAFRRGLDGWLYACHGYNNDTRVAGRDGETLHMNSGNTYRFRLDGSRIEAFTRGQVNPFGMGMDPRGDLYTADCHSAPVYVLLRGGHYPSFGKPHDGLGFVPEVMRHSHGSTAICGLAYYAAGAFPEELRDNTFIGNVMTSRVNRDRIEPRGSTIRAREMEDFLTTTDPWFRPVDLQLGPDGALYVADFYNRIIGHYEVPLDHPGRDRTSGRIWRIIHRDAAARGAHARMPDLTRASAEELVAVLSDDNLTRRLLATSELTDRAGESAVPALRRSLLIGSTAAGKAHALWALWRLGELMEEDLVRASGSGDPLLCQHVQRILAEMPAWSPALERLGLAGLRDPDPFVRRAAADALGMHPGPAALEGILAALQGDLGEDAFLRHTLRMALRSQVRSDAAFADLDTSKLSDADRDAIARVALAIPTPAAAAFLLAHVEASREDPGFTAEALSSAARWLPAEALPRIPAVARERFQNDLELQAALLGQVADSLERRGAAPGPEVRSWGVDLARAILSPRSEPAWSFQPHEEKPGSPNPWAVQGRPSSDGDGSSVFLSSLPLGEQLVGVLRSKPFVVPERLAFFIAGHSGFPDRPPHRRNVIRLRAEGGAVLAETAPPRNDVAQRVVWDLSKHAGERARLELVDGDDGGAYAWLAVGRFDPLVASVPARSPSELSAALVAGLRIAARLGLADIEPDAARLLADPDGEPQVREAAARALLAFRPDPLLGALAPLLGRPEVEPSLARRLQAAFAARDRARTEEAVAEAFKALPARLQGTLAEGLAGTPDGAGLLLDLAARGVASRRALLGRPVRERLAAGDPTLIARVEALTADLPPAREAIDRVIAERAREHATQPGDRERGALVFEKTCAPCHLYRGKGTLLAPQLDGIAHRGLERVLEDILDPNRNVDVAFRTTTYVLDDGSVLTGLFRRQEGESIILADASGKESAIARARIAEESPSEASLMPDNVADTLAPAELHDLLAYLLTAERRVLLADYSPDRRRLGIVGAEGRLDLERPIRDIHDLWLLPDGNVLYQTDWHHVIETDPAGETVWSYDASTMNGNAGKRVEVHAFQRLADGLTMIVESGTARIIEVDREGKLHRVVPLVVEHPDPHTDTRNARKLDSGNYLVAHEADGKVREYSPEGKVVWEHDAGGRIFSAVRLPGGNTLIGCGNLHKVIEVDPSGAIVWEVGEKDLPGITLAWVTQVAQLESGNRVIVNCHAGPGQPQIIEVTPQKRVVWTFQDFERFGNAMPVAHLLDERGQIR